MTTKSIIKIYIWILGFLFVVFIVNKSTISTGSVVNGYDVLIRMSFAFMMGMLAGGLAEGV